MKFWWRYPPPSHPSLLGAHPSYPQKDEAAVAVLKGVFPDRRIVAIDAEAVNLGGGGIHCITQQEPRVR